jgi:ankyrin repeat protein
LHFAGENGHESVEQLLLSKSADINARATSDNTTPLHVAVANRQKSMTELLLAKGAAVNAEDSEGRTPLNEARKRGYSDIEESLIRYGGQVTKPTDITIHEAAREGSVWWPWREGVQ